jgi:hypothetical protein
VVAKVRERLAVSKQLPQKVDVERMNLSNINDTEVRKEISDRSAALNNLHNREDIKKGWGRY